jgi:hypothetical protein
MATVLTKQVYPSAVSDTSSNTSLEKKEARATTTALDVPALGAPGVEKRFWFQRTKRAYGTVPLFGFLGLAADSYSHLQIPTR